MTRRAPFAPKGSRKAPALWGLALACVLGGAVGTIMGSDDAASGTTDSAVLENAIAAKRGKEAVAEARAKDAARAPADEQESRFSSNDSSAGSGGGLSGSGSDSSCIADRAAVEDLKRHREELEAKQKEFAAKEAELKAREQALDEELKKLEAARAEIAQLDESRRKASEEKVAKLVETLESMSPKAASAMLSTLDDALAVSAISRMDTLKLAKVMNVMDPSRSSKLSEILTGVVRVKAAQAQQQHARARGTVSDGTAVATNTTSAKGGEKYDGQNDDEQQDRSVQQKQQRKPGSDAQGAGKVAQ